MALPKRKVILLVYFERKVDMLQIIFASFFFFCLITRFKLVKNFFIFVIGVFVISYNKVFGGQTKFYHGVIKPRKPKNFAPSYKKDTSTINNEEVKFRDGKYTI